MDMSFCRPPQVTDQSSKRDLLMAMIKKDITPESRCIIFCNKKYICDELEQAIWNAGYNVAAIHGDKTQVRLVCEPVGQSVLG